MVSCLRQRGSAPSESREVIRDTALEASRETVAPSSNPGTVVCRLASEAPRRPVAEPLPRITSHSSINFARSCHASATVAETRFTGGDAGLLMGD
eukprot:Skav202249  [mRNA]  locus=scaffold1417:259009:263972:- [translate_table: standard]